MITLQPFVNIDAAVEQIEGWAETDWIGLWEIVAYVEEESGVDDSVRLLEATVNAGEGAPGARPSRRGLSCTRGSLSGAFAA